MTTPAQEIRVAISITAAPVHSSHLSSVATFLSFLVATRNCQMVKTSTKAGYTRLMTLLGMKIIRK